MDALYAVLTKIRESKPLVHHITNWVTIGDCAAATRATGALPVMAHAKQEAAEMATLSSALVLNIGTLSEEIIESMLLAAKAANAKGIPVVLDAVGVGATVYRTESARKLLSTVRVDVLKGNAGEIATLQGTAAEVRGVESVSVASDGAEIAKELAARLGCVVVTSGAVDYVSDGHLIYAIHNGSPIMSRVVGTGCMQTSVIGCFCAVESNLVRAAACAATYYGVCGQIAGEKALGAGTFRGHFFDTLENIDEKTLHGMAGTQRL